LHPKAAGISGNQQVEIAPDALWWPVERDGGPFTVRVDQTALDPRVEGKIVARLFEAQRSLGLQHSAGNQSKSDSKQHSCSQV
jgi:hypothetical protein